MWAIRQTLLLSTLLQAVGFAWADNSLPPTPTAPEAPNQTTRALPRFHFLNEAFLGQLEKSTTINPNFHSANNGSTGRPEALDLNQPLGLNLKLTGEHPGLEYKFSENGELHLRVGKHGGVASADWSF